MSKERDRVFSDHWLRYRNLPAGEVVDGPDKSWLESEKAKSMMACVGLILATEVAKSTGDVGLANEVAGYVKNIHKDGWHKELYKLADKSKIPDNIMKEFRRDVLGEVTTDKIVG